MTGNAASSHCRQSQTKLYSALENLLVSLKGGAGCSKRLQSYSKAVIPVSAVSLVRVKTFSIYVVANYRLRYGQVRSYGYRSLVSEYYLSSGETLI